MTPKTETKELAGGVCCWMLCGIMFCCKETSVEMKNHQGSYSSHRYPPLSCVVSDPSLGVMHRFVALLERSLRSARLGDILSRNLFRTGSHSF